MSLKKVLGALDKPKGISLYSGKSSLVISWYNINLVITIMQVYLREPASSNKIVKHIV